MVHIEGSVGPPASTRAVESANRVSRMPTIAMVTSAVRNRLVQLAAPATFGRVTSVQLTSTAK